MKKLLLFLFCCAFIASLVYNYYQWSMMKNQPVKIEKKTEIKYIEKKDSMPEAKSSKVVGHTKIPFLCHHEQGTESLDSVCKAVRDSVEVEITQKVYSDDSTYTAYVSGIKHGEWPRLDSINTYTRTVTHTVTKTITVREQESPFSIGLQAGYGYGFQYKGFEPYVGIGLTYRFNLFKRKKKPNWLRR